MTFISTVLKKQFHSAHFNEFNMFRMLQVLLVIDFKVNLSWICIDQLLCGSGLIHIPWYPRLYSGDVGICTQQLPKSS